MPLSLGSEQRHLLFGQVGANVRLDDDDCGNARFHGRLGLHRLVDVWSLLRGVFCVLMQLLISLRHDAALLLLHQADSPQATFLLHSLCPSTLRAHQLPLEVANLHLPPLKLFLPPAHFLLTQPLQVLSFLSFPHCFCPSRCPYPACVAAVPSLYARRRSASCLFGVTVLLGRFAILHLLHQGFGLARCQPLHHCLHASTSHERARRLHCTVVRESYICSGVGNRFNSNIFNPVGKQSP
mmetsp:Transcript_13525/g.26010  ORF Transcript_13525/g.26010 Transcript_13525/m.26010 type:complete len:239 (+) Transcript_13525:1144-1860(+)